ncbi:Meiotically up-regulated gene 154 protein [Golovinomyces cichoracearum]|uniref:Meiotically up-regulated gene 154 protein n=1 Tax=Golovinomyces cichoracearum TaxID=62708 RepID=A0A420IV24_9PEZI|nr:Meiotically up-regulated gene 154 protein [Golovinomyces cichoracearum]
MPRLIRRRPLLARIKDYLHPADWLLWLSEELETRDWDSTQVGNPVAALLHFITLISQANTDNSGRSEDDVFSDDYHSGSGWVGSMAKMIFYMMTALSVLNASYTFYRKRSYRLFESSIDSQPKTSSAYRVRVDSSPASSSPLRTLGDLLGCQNAEPKVHPNPMCHVWEIAVWDPLPVCLRLFCLFSPGHILVYWLFLPTKSMDPQPSVTVLKTICLQILMTSQLLVLQSKYHQQIKDSSIINKEVMNEYDIKFVNHRLNPPSRDVGTQYTCSGTGVPSEGQDSVSVYTPTIILKRGFRPNPNTNYSKYYDPDNLSVMNQKHDASFSNFSPSIPHASKTTILSESSPHPTSKQPHYPRSIGKHISTPNTTSSTDGGGTLGIYSHANSPLRKVPSINSIKQEERETPRNSFSMASREIREQNERRLSGFGKGHTPLFDRNHGIDSISGASSSSNSFMSNSNNQTSGDEDRWATNATSTATGLDADNTHSFSYRNKPRNAHERLSMRVPSRF